MPRPSSPPPARRRGRQARESRRRRVATLTAVLAGALLGAPLTAPAQAGAPAEADPLIVHLDSITPAALGEDDKPVRVTGTVTNQSAEQWTDVGLYAFASAAPIVDAPSLAASAAIDPSQAVGDRIVEPGAFDTVELLQPGETADFSITVPRDLLGMTEPGAYWFGVHAIGESSVGRDTFADGRARTFLPYVARTRKTVETSIVVPVREQVRHTAAGRVAGMRRWSASLADGGRLESLLDVGEAADGAPLTWLVDPAVLATVSRLSAGNPPRSLAPDPSQQPTDDGGTGTEEGVAPSPEASELGGAPLGPPAPADQELSADQEALAASAQAWLERFGALVAGQTVLALPYGDLDVSAAAAHGPVFYLDAVARSAEVMAAYGIAHTPALAPPDNLISPDALQTATPETTVLLGDTSFSRPPDSDSSMVRLLGHKVVVTSSGAAAGGPAPTAADDPLALRQRLLSEVALRLYAGSTAPVVLQLPDDWYPQDPAALFDSLDLPWLRPVPVTDITDRPAESLSAADLTYTEEDAAEELGPTTFSAAQALREQAAVMSGVLSSPDLVRPQVTDEALTTVSVQQRPRATAAAVSARAAAAHLDDQLASIDVVVPSSLTLSSADGTLGATVVNGLDQPVTVQVRAQTDGSLDVADSGVLHLGAGDRSRLLLDVSASRLGIHEVRLLVTDQDGTPLGGAAALPVRSAQVSAIIWYILVLGAVLLFGTILLRVVRQVRERRRTGEPVEAAGEAGAEAPDGSRDGSRDGATT